MDLTIPLVGLYSKELKRNVPTKTCKQMFTAALFMQKVKTTQMFIH